MALPIKSKPTIPAVSTARPADAAASGGRGAVVGRACVRRIVRGCFIRAGGPASRGRQHRQDCGKTGTTDRTGRENPSLRNTCAVAKDIRFATGSRLGDFGVACNTAFGDVPGAVLPGRAATATRSPTPNSRMPACAPLRASSTAGMTTRGGASPETTHGDGRAAVDAEGPGAAATCGRPGRADPVASPDRDASGLPSLAPALERPAHAAWQPDHGLRRSALLPAGLSAAPGRARGFPATRPPDGRASERRRSPVSCGRTGRGTSRHVVWPVPLLRFRRYLAAGSGLARSRCPLKARGQRNGGHGLQGRMSWKVPARCMSF